MEKAQRKLERRERAHLRVRTRIQGSSERPRLAVFKSARYIYAQVIDDGAGRTLAQASTADKEIRGKISGGGNIAARDLSDQYKRRHVVSGGWSRVVA